ncbi:DUF1127 domain-containing protein [Palleronia sp. LCG004]|uniref:DUF1127 domain-containing protein n=1 Tax=Palleronia sp. LCG004 TaxID=3079304 RepID=UPI002942AFB3|nr:DUF1127 domain-containing protein [Palleronia sp. LCG004]WOI55731.1 DUF1127 domain-containing protein [Palleronia sp. LCG004]
MADATFHTAHDTRTDSRTFGQTVSAFFSAIGHGLIAMGENSSRYRRLQALNAMTDEQLAQRGLKRENLVRHVFADVYYA